MGILGWALGSQQKALDNARSAAVDCSRRRLERAEVALFLEELHGRGEVVAIDAAATTHDREMSVRARAR